jgi:hypothetical protein
MAAEFADGYMPFWAQKWLTSESTRGMSLAARGAYIDLIAYQWTNGSIPNSIEKIARLLGSSVSDFEPIWSELAELFPVAEDVMRRANPKVEGERTVAGSLKSKRSDAARAANQKRWDRERITNGSESDPQPISDGSPLTPPPPTPKEKKEKKEKKPGRTAADSMKLIWSGLPSSHKTKPMADALELYLNMRSAKRYGQWGDDAVALHTSDFATMTPDAAIAALTNSAKNEYRAVIQPKATAPTGSKSIAANSTEMSKADEENTQR